MIRRVVHWYRIRRRERIKNKNTRFKTEKKGKKRSFSRRVRDVVVFLRLHLIIRRYGISLKIISLLYEEENEKKSYVK